MLLLRTVLLLCPAALIFALQDYCAICGLVPVRPRIFDGSNSNYGPWSVYIEYSIGVNLNFCTGTIIDFDHILTAAHCFLATREWSPTKKATVLSIFAGDTVKQGRLSKILEAESVHLHPKFKYTGGINSYDDVAIIKLKNSIEISSEIRPACLGGVEPMAEDLVLIQGYGFKNLKTNSDRLLEATMKVESDLNCKRVYGYMYTSDHMCAKNGTKAGCAGDSGGGLFKLNKGRQHVIGITSFGGNCDGFPGQAMIFTRISNYLQWIRNVTGQHTVNCAKKN